MPIEVPILEIKPPPLYQQIAAKAMHLRDVGMTFLEIGERLGIDRWTVGRAVRWMQKVRDG